MIYNHIQKLMDKGIAGNYTLTLYKEIEKRGYMTLENSADFTHACVPIFDEVRKVLGCSIFDVFQMVKENKVTSKMVADAFSAMTLEGGLYYKYLVE